jgi:hypothetical protein
VAIQMCQNEEKLVVNWFEILVFSRLRLDNELLEKTLMIGKKLKQSKKSTKQ